MKEKLKRFEITFKDKNQFNGIHKVLIPSNKLGEVCSIFENDNPHIIIISAKHFIE